MIGIASVALVGWGSRGLTPSIRSIGSVGGKDISVQSYASALRTELDRFSEQVGQPITLAQAQQVGLDRAVLARVITERALDAEAAAIGLSVGDVTVRDQILRVGAFQGLDGEFDRETYKARLQQEGLSEATYEQSLRDGVARSILQGGVGGGVTAPAVLADRLVAYTRESRAITWAAVTADALTAPVPAPTQAQLQAYYDAHPEAFTAPELRQISYVWLTPEMIQDQVTVDDQAVRDLYQERIDEYVRPERRLVERLAFLDDAAATTARARLDAGELTFDALVAERGLDLSDIDMGDVGPADLGEAAEAVFAAAPGDVVGPLPSAFGPALYRMNAVLAADGDAV